MKRESVCNTQNYILRLSNNFVWKFSSNDEVLQPWLEKTANIFGLEVEGCQSCRDEGIIIEDSERLDAPVYGCQYHDMNTFNVSHDIENRHLLYTVKPFSNKNDEIVAMKNALYPIYREIIFYGGQLIHGALIERNGQGVLLAGASGAGKSTSCRRLPDNWIVLSDDELLMLLNEEGHYQAYPLPTWSEYIEGKSEKTWNIHCSVPVCGVFFIEQSNIDAVIPLGKGTSASGITESSYQAYLNYWTVVKDQKQKVLQTHIFDNSCAMAQKIPAFQLQVSLHGRFWEEIERALGW